MSSRLKYFSHMFRTNWMTRGNYSKKTPCSSSTNRLKKSQDFDKSTYFFSLHLWTCFAPCSYLVRKPYTIPLLFAHSFPTVNVEKEWAECGQSVNKSRTRY